MNSSAKYFPSMTPQTDIRLTIWGILSRKDNKYLNSSPPPDFVLMFSDREEKVPASCCVAGSAWKEEAAGAAVDPMAFLLFIVPLPFLSFLTTLVYT